MNYKFLQLKIGPFLLSHSNQESNYKLNHEAENSQLTKTKEVEEVRSKNSAMKLCGNIMCAIMLPKIFTSDSKFWITSGTFRTNLIYEYSKNEILIRVHCWSKIHFSWYELELRKLDSVLTDVGVLPLLIFSNCSGLDAVSGT